MGGTSCRTFVLQSYLVWWRCSEVAGMCDRRAGTACELGSADEWRTEAEPRGQGLARLLARQGTRRNDDSIQRLSLRAARGVQRISNR